MAEKKTTLTTKHYFGLSRRDIVLLSLLALFLLAGLGLLGAIVIHRWPGLGGKASPTPMPAISKVANTSVTPEPPIQEPMDEPTKTPTPTPTSQLTDELTETPTITPVTKTNTPTFTPMPTDTPTNTPTFTPNPTDTPTITPTPTSTVTPNSAPIPPPPTELVVYVQSNGQTHSLGIVTSTGSPVDDDFHRHAAAPAWAPDRTEIAFFGKPGINELGGVFTAGEGVWIIDAEREIPRQLLSTDHVKNIAWSPDGAKLAFEFGPPDRTHEIIVISSIDGEQISGFLGGEQPAWSPDNEKLVIKNCPPEPEEDCGLWLVNVNGSDGLQITSDSTDSYPTWSPDGRYLVFSSKNRDDDWEIYRLRMVGDTPQGQPQRLTDREGVDTTPVFSPDDREIYIRTNAFGGWRITAIRVDGSSERLVKEGVGPSDDWGLARPAVH